MAKKLAYNYRFDPSAKIITISGYYTLRKLILITNVTDGTIIYNFADAGAGGSVQYNELTDETTITLAYNTTTMSDSDELQILIEDGQDTKIDAGESLIDPVHKFRVSNPQNLIDTDFEYGLQSSKWETIELVNNIPSVYSRDSAVSIYGIISVTTIANSDSVAVRTSVPHGLSVGDPIEVRGTNSRTAEGKYLITAAPSTTEFRYRATEVQSSNDDIKTVYTTIIPGSFFTGATIQFDKSSGIETDGLNPSTLTVTTDSNHGLSTSTSLYITNSVGKQEFAITNQTGTAPDGSPYVDATTNSIYIPNHNLYTGQRIYVSSTGALPTTASGAATLSGSTSCNTVYQAAKIAVDDIYSTLESNVEHGLFYMRRESVNNPYYNTWYYQYGIKPSGYTNRTMSQGTLYAEYDNSSHVRGFYKPTSPTSYTYYYWNSGGTNSETLFTGEPYDLGAFYFKNGSNPGAATLSGHNWYQSTQFIEKQFTPYILTVETLTTPDANRDAGFVRTSGYDFSYEQRWGQGGYANNDEWTGVNNVTSLGNGWNYGYGVTRWLPHLRFSNEYYMGYVKIHIHMDNSNWANWYSNGSNAFFLQQAFYNSQYTLDSRSFQFKGDQQIRIEALIPYCGETVNGVAFNSAASANVRYTYAELAARIASEVANTLGFPSFSAGTNTVEAVIQDGDRIRLRTNNSSANEYDFTSAGTGTISIETDQVTGVLDNYYTVTGTTANTLTISGSNQFAPRVLDYIHTDIIANGGDYYIRISGGHGIQNGQKVRFNIVTGSSIPGLASNVDYYAIVEDSQHLRLAISPANASAGSNAISGTPSSNGAYTLKVYSISGTVAGVGEITVGSESLIVTGTNTRFTTTFNPGDQLVIETTGNTVNNLVSRTIASVVNDTELSIASPLGFGLIDSPYYVSTKIHVRADGEFLHRPFDGGVDITAGKSPNSSIVRQTRKYFRYQSGKGIQCSMAINFNPARPVRSASGSGNVITMTTEYPHGLVAGNSVKITGAEEHISYSPTSASYNPNTGRLTVTVANHGFLAGEYVVLTEESFNFTCAKDGHATNHYYPRETDPAGGGTRLRIISVTTNDFVVDVGTSTYAGAHSIVSIAANAVTHIDTSNAYNGTYDIISSTNFTFTYNSTSSVVNADPEGFIEYAISGYKNAGLRAGLFDYQNGFFYEYDGKDLHCVRRSSVQQLSGTVTVVNKSNTFIGNNTRFTKQVKIGDMIVVRGQSYKITYVASDTSMDIQPAYRGTTAPGCVVTKTVDTRVKQADFNIDPVDGTGISGYNLDINKIQMAYMDYSWYGAGKIRFGFKDTYGHVKYVHEFVHNNKLNEAYMRTGNVPARYEAFNDGIPTFVPSLFHWGTSVIMDGGFDDDDSYLFTASGNPLTFTNGDADTATTTGASALTSTGYGSRRIWYLRLQFATADATKFAAGVPLYSDTSGGLTGEVVAYTGYGSGGAFYVYIEIATGFYAPASYPTVSSGVTVNIGAETVGTTTVDLNSNIPLISVRLSPSADNNLIGELGERDIINRMQLQMKELGISVTHDTNVSLILNGNLSNLSYQNVGSPSLTQYIAHNAGDTISGGIVIYSFRASGGSESSSGKRLASSEFFDISALVDLGNSIIGGNGVYPDGPDIITVACNVINTSEIDSTSAFKVSSRISWAESQA
jgi:hypothetical protein